MNESARKIAILYCIFASISTLINIGSQILFLLIYNGFFAIQISIFVGTLIGLPLRYYLEKRFIYSFESESVMHDSKLFFLYTLMAIFTTLIFWATEWVFHILFDGDLMRYLGAAIGLSTGYLIKYRLDKCFVFVSKVPKGEPS